MEGCQNKQNKMDQFDPDFIIPLAVLHSLSSVCATLLNALVLLAIWKTPSLRTPSRILLCSLALSDFCIGFIIQPLFVMYSVAALRKWTDVFCSIWAVNLRLGYCLAGVSFGTLTFISLDRYLAIKTKMSYKSLVTLKRVSLLVLCGWVLCIAGVSLAIQYFPFRTCLLVGSVFLVIGLLIITVSYSSSFLALKKMSVKVSCPATYSTSQNKLEQNASVIQLTNQSPQKNKPPTLNQTPLVTQPASIYKPPSMNQTLSSSVYQENQSASGNQENHSASVNQESQSASVNQDNQSVNQESQSASVNQDNQSVNQESQSASVNQENQSVNQERQSASVNQDNQSVNQESQSASVMTNQGNQSASVQTQFTSSRVPASTNFNVLKYKRSLITMLMILALTFLSYLPLICNTFITALITINKTIVLSHFSQFLVAFNSTLNPLFYMWRMKDLRIAANATLRSIISKVRCH